MFQYEIANGPDSRQRPAFGERELSRLFRSLRIAVIHGGDKEDPGSVIYRSHNPRTWKSYEEVAGDIAAALRRIGFRQVELLPEDMRLGDRLRQARTHLAWLNSGGVQGYNPLCHAPALLEMLGMPYVGHSPLNASAFDNKHVFKRELVAAGLPTSRFMAWRGGGGAFRPHETGRFHRAFGDYAGPFIAKPDSGRASLDVHVVDDVESLVDAVNAIYAKTRNLVLIEKYLPGREFCIGVAGPVVSRGGVLEHLGAPFAFSAVERHFDAGERIFTSMDVKPITGRRFHAVDPEFEPELVEELGALARKIYMEFNCETLIRIDLRSDDKGRLHILEANPKPDLKQPGPDRTCLLSSGLARERMSYDDLIFSQIANTLHLLLADRKDTVPHIAALVD
ncbi:D-alanyl-alanine synthetase [Oceanibacterium hippocampi]|uniref:D-alanine--D-alanine ligase B n=1 Tax=Oceanibacterium hippocampi TaxID=745714 RepID=A0A1Y5R771_9PROT|nr:D-alanyl-alanine synthetase [Oceanibacterium hippocampi]SLN10795.1 D-alanine--D-alanine ligase B [Oceanibacterium hippocampi]